MKLEHIQTITVPAIKKINVKDFFESQGIWASERFKDGVLSKSSKTITVKNHEVDIYRLKENASDSEIIAEVKSEVKSVDEYLASIISRIKNGNQWLLTDGYANIEYVNLGDRIFVVCCCFDSSGWYFDCGGLDGYGVWTEGRVSSSATSNSTTKTLNQSLGNSDSLKRIKNLEKKLEKVTKLAEKIISIVSEE